MTSWGACTGCGVAVRRLPLAACGYRSAMADGRQGPAVATERATAARGSAGGSDHHSVDRSGHGDCVLGEHPAVVLLLPMPGMRADTLRVCHAAGSLVVSAVGRSALIGIDPADAEQLSTVYRHDIELDHRIDGDAIRAELDGSDGVRLVLPLRRGGARLAEGRFTQPVG